MDFVKCRLPAGVFVAAILACAIPASAGGPLAPKFMPLPHDGTCEPIQRSNACQRTDKDFTVNKADGSGTTTISIIENNTLSFSRIANMTKALGEPFHPKTDSYEKKTIAARTYYGAMLKDTGEIIENAMYPYFLPVSDKVAIAKAHEYSGTSGGVVHKFYWVNLDGKLTEPERPGMKPNTFYYIGGYEGFPVQVFEYVSHDTERGTYTLRQYDAYGKERAIFDNIVLHKRRDENDSFELDFFPNSTKTFVVSALHPDTGEPASLWFATDGSVLGYRPPAEVRSVLAVDAKKSRQDELVQIVGQLPVRTGLKDDRLYHPLDMKGERVAAPDNFLGMARMFSWSGRTGGADNGQVHYRGWLLVYDLGTGYGYKISDRATTASDYPWMVTAEEVLKSEGDLKMLAGFEAAPIDGYTRTVIRLFDRYEADGITPAAGAVPASWRQVNRNSDNALKVTATTELREESYATANDAFAAIKQREMEHKAEYARRQEVYRQEMAVWQAERDAQEARYQAEQQARLEREAAQEAEWARKRAQYRPKTGAEEYAERLEAYRRQQGLSSGVDTPFKRTTTECYDQGDGTEKCFTR